MARQSKRDRIIAEIQQATLEPVAPEIQDFNRFLECPELHKPSEILVRAAETLRARGQHYSAFTAETNTPLLAPPGWLPPPI